MSIITCLDLVPFQEIESQVGESLMDQYYLLHKGWATSNMSCFTAFSLVGLPDVPCLDFF